MATISFFRYTILYYILCYSTLTLTALRRISIFTRGNAHSIIFYDTCYGIVHDKQHFEIDSLQNTALHRFFLHLSISSNPIYVHIECNESAKSAYVTKPPIYTTFLEQTYRQYAQGYNSFGVLFIDSWDIRTKQDADILELLSLFTDGLVRRFGSLLIVPHDFQDTPMEYFVSMFDKFYSLEFFSADPRASTLRRLYELYKQLALGVSVQNVPALHVTSVNDFLSRTSFWITRARMLKERMFLLEEYYNQFYQAVARLKAVIIDPYCLSKAGTTDTYENITLNEILIDNLEKQQSLKYFWHEICLLFDQIAAHESDISLYQMLIATSADVTCKRTDIFHVGTERRSIIEQYYASQGYSLVRTIDVTQFSLERPALFREFMVDLAQHYKYL